MGQTAGGPRFLLESPAPIDIGRERGRQHLDRDGPLELVIARAKHLAHTASPKKPEDLEAAETVADGQTQGAEARL